MMINNMRPCNKRGHQEILESKQLFVEGEDVWWFLKYFLEELNLTGIQIQNFGGKDELDGFLKLLPDKVTNISRVQVVGIIRDADDNPQMALASVIKAAAHLSAGEVAGLHHGCFVDTSPRIGVYILPGGMQPGTLEDLLLRTIPKCSSLDCVDQFVSCLNASGVLPAQQSKVRCQAFLATRQPPERLVGKASENQVWKWDCPALEELKRFLQAM